MNVSPNAPTFTEYGNDVSIPTVTVLDLTTPFGQVNTCLNSFPVLITLNTNPSTGKVLLLGLSPQFSFPANGVPLILPLV